MSLNLQGLAGAQGETGRQTPPFKLPRRPTADDGDSSPALRKRSPSLPYGVPVALYFDKELANIPEPMRSDYQILVDERADELVHKVMTKYRDQIWKEMAEDRKKYTKDIQDYEQKRIDELAKPYFAEQQSSYYIDPYTGLPVYDPQDEGEADSKGNTPADRR